MDLPRGHRVTALPRRYVACLLFPGMFAQMVAHITGLRGRASAFPAMVPQWLVNYSRISLLVAQLFLINLNIYTESRLLSKAEFVACVHSCVVPGAVAAEPCRCLPPWDPCLPGVPAYPASTGDGSRQRAGGRPLTGEPTRREEYQPMHSAFKGLGACFFQDHIFSCQYL